MNSNVSHFSSSRPIRYHESEPDIFVRRNELHPNLLVGEANTFGWDIVNTIRLPEINKSLAIYPTPPPFEYFIDNGDANDPRNSISNPVRWSITGRFGSWMVRRGGAGSIIFMEVPLTNSEMIYGDDINLQLKDLKVTVQVKLNFLPRAPSGFVPGEIKDKDAEFEYLAVNAKSRSMDDPAAIIQNIDYGVADVSTLERALFSNALFDYFRNNLHLFTYVFAVASVNAIAGNEIFQWMKATSTNYAYCNGSTDQTSYLAVLGLVQGRSVEGLSNQLSAAVIPFRCNSSLTISNQMFLRNVVLPGLPKALANGTAEDFVLTGNNSVIESRSPVDLDDLAVDGKTYTPVLERLIVQIIGDEMQIFSTARVNIKQGLDIFVESTNYFRIRLVQTAKPGKTLDFLKSRPVRTRSWYLKSKSTVITELLTQLIDLITSTIKEKAIDVSSKDIISATLIVALEGISAAQKDLIGKVAAGKASEVLSNISSLVEEGSDNAEWFGVGRFEPQTAEFNGALVFGGDVRRLF